MREERSSGGSGRSWRQIPQRVPVRATGPASRSRWRRRFKMTVAWAVAGIASLTVVYLAYFLMFEPDKTGRVGLDLKVEEIVVVTDGTLTVDWVERSFGLRRGQNLLEMDIFQLQRSLMRVGQIEKAEIVRRPPSTLEIRLRERTPLFRMRVSREGVARNYLVATDGIVYDGWGYSPRTVRVLPFLTGVSLQEEDGAFLPVAGFARVAELVETARREHAELFRSWRFIDLSLFDPDPLAVLSTLRVGSLEARSILFRAGDFQRQLERLESIILFARDRELPPYEMIDLRYEDNVPVQLGSAERR